MSDATVKLMTSDDLFALPPSKRVDRWLFRGELRESKVTKRNPNHSGPTMAFGGILRNWAIVDPTKRGKVHGGEVYFRIRRDPDTNVGIDVALATPAQQAAVTRRTNFIDGPPVLAAEVLSPNDKHRDIVESVREYLECGVKVVLIIDPYQDIVTVYRPGVDLVVLTRADEFVGDPELPGFRCRVAEIFE